MEHDKQGELLIKRKLLQRLMYLEAGQLFCTPPSHLFRRPFAILIDAWEHRWPEFTLVVEGKRNGICETGQQMDKVWFTIPSSSWKPWADGLLMSGGCCWRMSGGQREPTERSIVLHWPVKNSIIPRSHLWLAPSFQLVQQANTEQ